MIFFQFIWIYIIPILMISPILSFSMNSWFSIWMMLELNMMSFIPLMIFLNKYFKENIIKYFIIQSFSSSLLILSSNLFMILFNLSYFYQWMNLMINLSLIIKIGMAPFHSWFINLMNNLNWLSCLILSTWQKIIPLMMISYNFNLKLIYMTIILSTLISSFMSLNHQSIRIILSYSSLNHMSWILMNMIINEMMWIYYFIFYTMMSFPLMIIMNNFNIYYINQMILLNNKMKLFMMMNFISMSSMPPLFGFLIKWMSLFYFSLNNNFIIPLIMIFMSLLTFILYNRTTIILFSLFKSENKLMMFNKMINLNLNYLIMLTIMFFLNLWIMNIFM